MPSINALRGRIEGTCSIAACCWRAEICNLARQPGCMLEKSKNLLNTFLRNFAPVQSRHLTIAGDAELHSGQHHFRESARRQMNLLAHGSSRTTASSAKSLCKQCAQRRRAPRPHKSFDSCQQKGLCDLLAKTISTGCHPERASSSLYWYLVGPWLSVAVQALLRFQGQGTKRGFQ